jgi:hypothetical protein
MGVAFQTEAKKQLRELRALRDQIDGAIYALSSRPMVVTPRPPDPAPPPKPALNPVVHRRKRRRDNKAQEHTLNYMIARGHRGVTPLMVSRALRCSLDAARERLARLVSTGLVIKPADGSQIWRTVP